MLVEGGGKLLGDCKRVAPFDLVSLEHVDDFAAKQRYVAAERLAALAGEHQRRIYFHHLRPVGRTIARWAAAPG